MTDLIPVVLFVYRRPEHTRLTVEALQRNLLASETKLYVFSDAARQPSDEQMVRIVRDYINNISGFRNIYVEERSVNLGLANSVISGVTEIIDRYGRVIVLEDDIITAPHFLTFMNECLDFYQDDLRIGSVTGYSWPIAIPSDYPWSVYMTHRHSSWGWGTYQRVWKDIDWEVCDYNKFRRNRSARRAFNIAGDDIGAMLDKQIAGEIDSWSIRFDYTCFQKHLLSLASVNNLVMNTGFDGTGIHCSTKGKRYKVLLVEEDKSFNFPVNPTLDPRIVAATRKIFANRFALRVRCLMKSLVKLH